MATRDNAPPPDDWGCEGRPCPIPCNICVAEPVTIPANVVLGTE